MHLNIQSVDTLGFFLILHDKIKLRDLSLINQNNISWNITM